MPGLGGLNSFYPRIAEALELVGQKAEMILDFEGRLRYREHEALADAEPWNRAISNANNAYSMAFVRSSPVFQHQVELFEQLG